MPDIPAPLQQIIKICEAVNRGEALASELSDYFVKARQTVQYEQFAFERLSWSAVWTEKLCDLLGQMRVELDAHLIALGDLEEAAEGKDYYSIEKCGRDLQYSAESVSNLSEALKAEIESQQVYSPYPVFDKLLKVCQNVLKQNIAPDVLSSFMPPAVNFVLRLKASVKRFGIFYGQSSIWEYAHKVCEHVEAGMGALDRFLRTGHEKCLTDGIEMLMGATAGMFMVVSDMGKAAANERKHAEHYLAEELFRARECCLSGEDLEMLWQSVQSSLQLELTQVKTLVLHPLGTLCGVHKKELLAVMNLVNASVKKGMESGLESLDLAGIDRLLINFDKLIEDDLSKVNLEFRLASGAPNFEELLVAAGLICDEKMNAEAFRIILQSVSDNIAEVMNSLDSAAGGLDPEDWSLLSHCTEVQMEACRILDEACEEPDIESLRHGWRLIAGTLPSMVRICREMKKSLGAGSESSRTVTCMRCGHVNPQNSKYCSKCSSVLIQLASAPVEYTDMESGETDGASGSVPKNILKLESLIRAVEEGSSYTDEVDSCVGGLLQSAYSYRTIYFNKVRSALSRDGVDESLVERFENDMNTYIEGLEICAEFVNNPSMDYLYRGYEQACAGAVDLADIQEELNNYF